jgi:hypothetical protein
MMRKKARESARERERDRQRERESLHLKLFQYVTVPCREETEASASRGSGMPQNKMERRHSH